MRCNKCSNGVLTDNGYYCECYDEYDMDWEEQCPWFMENK